ncbi:MAG: hypothetical protein ABUL62_33710 [Myxococcales bacterium]
MKPAFVRIQVRYCGKLGLPVGIFGACHHLRRAGRLSPEDDQLFEEVKAWFIRELPEPPFYGDGNSIKAITWFKQSAVRLIAAAEPLQSLLSRYQVSFDVVETDDPGDVVYEDEFQVGVINARFPSG